MTAPHPVHRPVLLDEVVAALAPRAGGIYVDGTFGAGGYATALLEAAACRVIGIDRDPEALGRGAELARRFGPALTLVEGRFGDMVRLLADIRVDAVDGIAFDLGVSSPQLDQPERGFSFRADGPLDMRMGAAGETAADLIQRLGETELADIIYRLGEERHSRRVAKAIVTARRAGPLTRTSELAELVRRVVPRSKDGIDPATRTFQALRIAVNDELGEIDRGLAAAERLLRPSGRLAAVAFHSLEDARVKSFLKERSGAGAAVSRHAPTLGAGREPSFRLLARRAIKPGEAELQANPRARSARLRIAERTAAPAAGSPP